MDEAEFTAFASARWPPLVRAGVMLGCSTEDAHDLAQTTLLRCYTAWRRVQRADDVDAYVYRILLNCHRDNRRRKWWGERPTSSLPDASVDDSSARVDAADAVNRALHHLSAEHREIVLLRYYADLTEGQTAKLLGIRPGTVKSRLSRALTQLATSDHLDNATEGKAP